MPSIAVPSVPMTALQHYLRPLLAPASVALVGASDKPASLGRIVFENLLEGGFKGDLYAVNPNHRRLLGRRCFASLAAIGKPVELALIAVPCAAVTGVLDEARALRRQGGSDPVGAAARRRRRAALAARRSRDREKAPHPAAGTARLRRHPHRASGSTPRWGRALRCPAGWR